MNTLLNTNLVWKNPKKKVSIVTSLIIFIYLLSSCNFVVQDEADWICPPLPTGFQESDLQGTWQANYGGSDTDIIEIKDDGRYKQTYSSPIEGYYYEGSWNRWWLEHRDSGGLYLHLDHMHRCDDIHEICELEEGGGGEHLWWDFCEDRVIQMQEEVILMVTGVPEGHSPAPLGIWLWHLSPDPDSVTYYFTLQE